jgi:hypothetical protein
VVQNGRVTEDAQVAAVQWGDIHVANIDPRIQRMFWGEGGVLDTLRPRQADHARPRGRRKSHNHAHSSRPPSNSFRLYSRGPQLHPQLSSSKRASFVDEIRPPPVVQDIVVVWSNHDEFIRRYLQDE